MNAASRSARVSVLLPCYNATDFLEEALLSLLQQTFPDFEIIAVDDGSTDSTANLLREFADRDHRITVVNASHRGLVATLNTALAHANGELIARFDADDIAEPIRFERQIDLLDSEPGIAACGTGVRYFPRSLVRDGARAYEQWINSLHSTAALERNLFVECPIVHPTLMARASTMREVGGYRGTDWPEDYDLILRLHAAGHALANVPEVLHHWRDRRDRLSRTDPRYSLAAFRRCKVHYLKSAMIRDRTVVVWGAGPVGKAFALELRAQGLKVTAFLEVDKRKVGQQPHGIPVLQFEQLPRGDDVFILAAVGSPAARREIRAALDNVGLVELRDYCAVA